MGMLVVSEILDLVTLTKMKSIFFLDTLSHIIEIELQVTCSINELLAALASYLITRYFLDL